MLKEITLYRERASVYQILESLVKSQPGYELDVENGVVHVFQKDSLTDKRSFLNIQIHKFEVHNEFGANVSRRLMALVNQIVSPPVPSSLKGGGVASSWPTSTDDQ